MEGSIKDSHLRAVEQLFGYSDALKVWRVMQRSQWGCLLNCFFDFFSNDHWTSETFSSMNNSMSYTIKFTFVFFVQMKKLQNFLQS
eukprot:Gb_19373 [translate_table: standard]